MKKKPKTYLRNLQTQPTPTLLNIAQSSLTPACPRLATVRTLGRAIKTAVHKASRAIASEGLRSNTMAGRAARNRGRGARRPPRGDRGTTGRDATLGTCGVFPSRRERGSHGPWRWTGERRGWDGGFTRMTSAVLRTGDGGGRCLVKIH